MTNDPLDLSAIEARLQMASHGPWRQEGHSRIYGPGFMVAEHISKRDAEWIAHAREDMPALVAEIRRLRQETR